MDCWDSYALIFTKTTKWRGNWPIIELAAQKTGLSGAFISLFRLPVDNFASGSKLFNLFLLTSYELFKIQQADAIRPLKIATILNLSSG